MEERSVESEPLSATEDDIIAQSQGGKEETAKKRVIYYVISLFQRFIPEIMGGPATLLHGGCAKGPYRISTVGGSGCDCLGSNGGGPPACDCGCCC